jgi:hypothetical protein
MSLDIEGAELKVLQGLPFEKYTFGALDIEHNEEEPKRTDILLRSPKNPVSPGMLQAVARVFR